jgi:hypothetical protein
MEVLMVDYDILIDDELALDDERMTELSSDDFNAMLTKVGEDRLRRKARFALARGEVERLSAVGNAEKARYRLPLRASFLPPQGARFAQAHLVIALDAHADLDILAVHPVEQSGKVEVEIETKTTGEATASYEPVKLGRTQEVKKTYKSLPITVRGIGPGSDCAEWMFDGPAEEGGLPTQTDLRIDVAVLGPRLVAGVRMTAGVRWSGIMGMLPFVWPRGSFRTDVIIDLPAR